MVLPSFSIEVDMYPTLDDTLSFTPQTVEVATAEGAIYTCKHVIVTPSIEILKNFDFRPPLPSFKLEVRATYRFRRVLMDGELS